MASVRQKIIWLLEYIDDEEPDALLELDDEGLFKFVRKLLPHATIYEFRLAQAQHSGDDDTVAEIQAYRNEWLDRYAAFA